MQTVIKRNSGFTIVELLIVIVVIAILASISVTTFRGIQDRATNTARISEARKLKGLIEQYLAINGSASMEALMPTFGWYCLGTGYTDLDPGAGVSCEVYQDTTDNTPYYSRNSTVLDNALSALGGYSVAALPLVEETDNWVDNGTTHTYSDKYSSAFLLPFFHYPTYYHVNGQPAFIRLSYRLKGDNVDCGMGNIMVVTGYSNPTVLISTQTGARNSSSYVGVTYCNVHIPRP